MLVISRKRGQRLYIGDYEVTVVSIQPGKVRLGIVAPRSVPVDREEVRKRKERKNAAA